jgi:peptidoglycan hydrolase-like protein with peptidoglycan-binding domain
MKRYVAVGCVLAVTVAMAGCNKRESMEQAPENMSMDELGAISQAPVAAPETKAADQKSVQAGAVLGQPVAPKAAPQQQTAVPVEAVIEPVSSVPAAIQPVAAEAGKPNPMDIQTALKNAGFYNGKIDGKLGPMSTKAIQEFQKANKLKADGKVGRKTWEALSRHLTAAPSQQ